MGESTLQIRSQPQAKVILDPTQQEGFKLKLDEFDPKSFRKKFQIVYPAKPEFRFQVSLRDLPNLNKPKEPQVQDSIGERCFQQYHETYPCEQYLGCARIVTLFRFPFD